MFYSLLISFNHFTRHPIWKICAVIFVSMELSVYNNHTDFAREIDRYIFHCIIVFCMQWRWQMSVFNCIKNVSVAEIHVILLFVCYIFFPRFDYIVGVATVFNGILHQCKRNASEHCIHEFNLLTMNVRLFSKWVEWMSLCFHESTIRDINLDAVLLCTLDW